MAENWFKTGEAGFRAKDQIDAAMAVRKERGVPRFMLKANEEATIVFVDETPFFVWEHNLKVGGKWGNYVTCTKEVSACDTCNSGDKSTYTGYLTIIDMRTFIKRDGTQVSKRKILYPAKGSTIKRLEDLKKKHGGLRGLAFKVKRYTKDDPNCGTDFEYIKTVNLTGDYSTKIDYEKILAPATPEELKALGVSSSVHGKQNDLTGLEAPPPSTSTTTETDNFEDVF